MKQYPEKSWYDSRLEKRSSPIHGTGIYATAFIKKGELIARPGGIVATAEDLQKDRLRLDPTRQWNQGQIDDNLYLINALDEDISYFFNHSCDPNFWGDTARRDIEAEEELTFDYGMEAMGDYLLEPCLCGSPLCRGKVTGRDWLLPELQERYEDHFPAYILRAIAKHKSSGGG
jgi:uncharacterized protein